MPVFPFVSEIVALCTGFIFIRYTRLYILRIFFLLLILTVVMEGVLIPNCKIWWDIRRNVVYNIFSLIDMSIWFLFFIRIFLAKRSKFFIAFIWIACLGFSLIELFYLKSWASFHTDSLRFFNLVAILLSIIYLFQLLKKEYHLIFSDPVFWLCAAGICFNSIFFVNLSTFAEAKYWKGLEPGRVFYILQCTAMGIYYLFICFAFITSYYNYKAMNKAYYQS